MTRSLLIGIDGSDRSADAIAFGALLAPLLRAEPVLLHAHPYGDLQSLLGEGEYERLIRGVVETAADRAERLLGRRDAATLRLVAARSPAAALQAAATESDAAAIVLGSSRRGRIGRVLPGGAAQRLLSGSPCPVAVAPARFAARQPPAVGAIGCGFDGSPESFRALRVATRLSQANDGPLRVLAVHQRVAFGQLSVVGDHALASVNQRLKWELAEQMRRAGDEIGLRADTTISMLEGDPAAVLAGESAKLGLLVVGSRGFGPLGSVLLGSVASKLLRTARCPVMVVPRGLDGAAPG